MADTVSSYILSYTMICPNDDSCSIDDLQVVMQAKTVSFHYA